MQEILSRINDLSPEQLALFEEKLRGRHIDLQEYRMKNLGIGKVKEADTYPASSIQKRLFMLHQIGDLGCSYNMPAMIRIKGSINYLKIEDAINKIVEKHEILRTVFDLKDGEVVQKICTYEKINLEYKAVDEQDLLSCINGFIKPFDLMTGPLFRYKLCKLDQRNHVLLLDIHHIISDGESMKIFINEFKKAYEEGELDESVIQYKDFSVWEKEFKGSTMMKNHEIYWTNIFKEPVELLNLPLDYPRPLYMTFKGNTISFQINAELTEQIRNIAKENNATLFMTLLSFYYILLYKYTGQMDIVIGTPVTGRYHNDLKHLLGMFVNTLALRNYPKGNKSYLDFLNEIISNSIQCYKHEAYSFEELISRININNNKGHNILFDTMLVLQYGEDRVFHIGDAEAEICDIHPDITKFDLTFIFNEYDKHINFQIEYNTNLFLQDTIVKMGNHFLTILNKITKNTRVLLSDLCILNKDEIEKILEFNLTNEIFDDKVTLVDLFEIQVSKCGNAIAIISGDRSITYQELNARANQLARTLRNKGIGSNDIVALLVDRTIEMIVGIFAILKAGAAYLPIDKAYPIGRIKYMLEDSNTSLLLVDEDIDTDIPCINIIKSENYDESMNNLPRLHTENDLAYIIYTSGTTGKPKGVMVEHRNITNTIQWRVKEYHCDSSYITIQLFSHAFDGFITSFFTPIVSGGKIILPSVSEAKSPEHVKRLIAQHKVTHFIVVPSFYEILLECFSQKDLESVKVITLAGEKVSKKQIEKSKVLKNELEIVNEYGPTENSVATTICRNLIPEDNIISIGKPIANTRVYILDKDDNLCPIGMEGELCISGKGIARGYINKLELTEQKFVINPYENNERMYRTGDICRWLANGTIEFLQRKDKQLKIRGYRVEINEIIECLENISYIRHAIVCMKGEANTLLCAYLVSEIEVEAKEIHRILSNQLPEYMIPSHIFFITHIPTTPAGKLDEKALPEPVCIATDGTKGIPTNETEEKLLSLFREILQVEQLGIHHDFFELGGQSLKAGQLTSRIFKVFNVLIPMKLIFEQPTVSKLAVCLTSLKDETDFKIENVEANDNYCTSFAQKNLFFLSQAEGVDTTYNMPCILDIKGEVDLNRLEAAFMRIVQRHEILRTAFKLEDGEVVQNILEEIDFKLQTIKCSYIDIEKHKVDFIKMFRLEEAPLLRVCLLHYGKHMYKLFMDMHHIIGDAKSISILINELISLYKGEELPELKLQYKDFAAWQNSLVDSDYIKQQRDYWKNIYEKEIPLLSMPLDNQRPSIQSFKGDRISLELNKELSNAVRELCQEKKLTTYMFFLACYYLLLHKYSSQKDIIVGTPVEGRTNPNVDSMIGMFVNTLALRAEIDENLSIIEFLNYIKLLVINGLNNQDYPFIELVQSININREQSRNPLFDTMFSMNDLNHYKFEIGDTEFKTEHLPGGTSKFDITLDINELGENFECELEYCTDLFTREKIQHLLMNYTVLIKEAIDNPMFCIKNIPFVSSSEVKKILSFNKKRVPRTQETSIVELFEKQVVLTPNAVAVSSGENTITYQELNRQSNRVAHRLQDLGVKADTIIGLFITPSIEMIVSMLGVIKAGGCYLPIDTGTPIHRAADILQDADVSILLTDQIQTCEAIKVKQICEVVKLIHNTRLADSNPSFQSIRRNQLMYVIYTSGSTGKPKGVLVEHGNVLAYVEAFKYEFKINATDVMLQQASCSFDTFVEEVYPLLITGGKIVIAQKECVMDVNALLTLIYKEEITMISCSPLLISILNQNEDLGKVHTVISGGDVLRYNYISNLLQKVKVYNTYGPTEATVCAAYHQCRSNDTSYNVSIGKPILNYEIFILNEYGQLVPIGVAGELCIGGLGIARGYLKRPELTKEKFISHPFLTGETIYKTGDLAKWSLSGDIDFLGRIDNQVKIRGYRIELEEIEQCLTNCTSIDKAVVLPKGEGSDKRLLAYLVANKKIEFESLKVSLRDQLPHYMIPDHFIQLEHFPTTNNGKIDKNELQRIEVTAVNQIASILPTNDTEKIILDIWKELFQNDNLGIRHNFFDIGGHSLKAMQMIVQAQKKGIDVKLNQIMKYQTVEELSAQIMQYEDENQLITDIDVLNIKLKEQFLDDNRIVIYDVQGERYVILFLSVLAVKEKEKIVSFIYRYCNKELFPHYIRVAGEYDFSFTEKRFLLLSDFSDYLGLLKPDLNEELDNVMRQAMQQQEKLNQFILQKEIMEEMQVSASQKMYLDFHNGYSGTVINYDKPINLEYLTSAIKKLIENQPFMHSTFEKTNQGYIWKRRCINSFGIELPFIDLSVFNIVDRELLKKKIIQHYYYCSYQLYSAILFRVLVLRESEKNYSVIFPFHHIIFDDMSENIVREKLLNYYYSFEKAKSIKAENLSEYSNFTQQLKSISKVLQENKIIELFDLNAYTNALSLIKNQMEERPVDKVSIVEDINVEIQMPINYNIFDENYPLNLALNYIKEVLENYFSVDALPIIVLTYGRRFENFECLNVIGAFIDFIPVLIKQSNKSMAEILINSMHLASKENINFINLIETTDFCNLKSIFNEILEFMISVNFLGRQEMDNDTTISYLEEYAEVNSSVKKINFNGLSIEISYTSNKLKILIQSQSYNVDEKLKKLFYKKAIEFSEKVKT